MHRHNFIATPNHNSNIHNIKEMVQAILQPIKEAMTGKEDDGDDDGDGGVDVEAAAWWLPSPVFLQG